MRSSGHNLDGLMTPTSHRSRSSRSSILTGDGHDFSFKRKHRVSASEHSIPSPRHSYSPLGGHRQSVAGSTHSRHSSQQPLVLLHVSLLPSSGSFCDIEVLKEINAPKWVIENQRLLSKRLDSNTRKRGLLITHPGEEYDLLEERILESLNLCPPRLLACGHFNMDAVTDRGDFVGTPNPELTQDALGTDERVFDTCCEECRQPIREVDQGAGVGNRRYDIQVFAANGLLRSGAWSAAYREMEKIDIEVNVWLPEQVRKDLELWHEQQAAKNSLQLLKLEEKEQRNRERDEMLDMALSELRRLEKAKQELEEARKMAEDQVHRLKDELRQAQTSRNNHAPSRTIEASPIAIDGPCTIPGTTEDIPITTLLRNCCHIVVTDRRNIAVVLLSIVVAMLAYRMTGMSLSSSVDGRVPEHMGIVDTISTVKGSFTNLTSSIADPLATMGEQPDVGGVLPTSVHSLLETITSSAKAQSEAAPSSANPSKEHSPLLSTAEQHVPELDVSSNNSEISAGQLSVGNDLGRDD